jgi:hypothetical protein
MNWGYKIMLVYIVFVAGILLMVFRSSGERTDLVTNDYYAQELKFQERIDQQERTRSLSEPVRYELNGNTLLVHFPPDFKGKAISGNISIYCPADQKQDIQQAFNTTGSSTGITVPAGIAHAFELHVSWKCEDLNYYFEKKIYR